MPTTGCATWSKRSSGSPLKGQRTFVVVSDHGFLPIEKEIRPNVLLKQLGLIDAKAGAEAVPVRAQRGARRAAAVYILDDARRIELAAGLRDQLAALPGIAAVLRPDQFERIGQPTRSQNPHGADLWLSASSGYSFSDSLDGDNPIVRRNSRGGTHGYLPEQNDLHATCVLWGEGIQAGRRRGPGQQSGRRPHDCPTAGRGTTDRQRQADRRGAGSLNYC